MVDLKLISGTSNRALALEISEYLRKPLADCEISRFSDGEIYVQINESVRGSDVFVIQSLSDPVNDNIMELLVVLDALKRSSVNVINVVLPYYAYARQDRKVQPRAPISAKLLADLITVAGADRIMSMDLHAGQIQGFFDIPFDHLYAAPIMLEYIKNLRFDSKNIVIVSPDAGGVERARYYAKNLGCTVAFVDKRRPKPNVSQIMHIVGEIKDKIAIIVDDLVDTAGTLVNAAEALKEQGATEVYGFCTHPVLSGPAIERIENSCLKELIVTNTITFNRGNTNKIKVLSVGNIIGEAIRRIYHGESVSALFD